MNIATRVGASTTLYPEMCVVRMLGAQSMVVLISKVVAPRVGVDTSEYRSSSTAIVQVASPSYVPPLFSLAERCHLRQYTSSG